MRSVFPLKPRILPRCRKPANRRRSSRLRAISKPWLFGARTPSSSLADAVLSARFAHSNREPIRAALIEYDGHRLCVVRMLTDHFAARDQRQLARKGIYFEVGLLPDIIAAERVMNLASIDRPD